MTNDPTSSADRAAANKRARPSRYLRAQQRREAQRRADQRFYNGIFGIIGACVLVVLGLAMIASSGQTPQISTGPNDALMKTTFLGLTGLEWGGLLLVVLVGLFMWRRIKRK